jgi:predicted nucleic acid-binding protein
MGALEAFQGKSIYIDTMIFYLFARGITPSVKQFMSRLEQGEFSAFTSVLTFDELAYRLLLARIKDTESGAPLDRLREEEKRLLSVHMPIIANYLDQLRAYPNLLVLDAMVDDLAVMNRAMVSNHLRPRDALHYAAMQRAECTDLASNDPHFDTLPGINRYNLPRE